MRPRRKSPFPTGWPSSTARVSRLWHAAPAAGASTRQARAPARLPQRPVSGEGRRSRCVHSLCPFGCQEVLPHDLPGSPVLGHRILMGRSLTGSCWLSSARRLPASDRDARRVVRSAPPLFTSSVCDLPPRTRATNRTERAGPLNPAPLDGFRSSAGRVWRLRNAAKRLSFDNPSADAIACLPAFIQALRSWASSVAGETQPHPLAGCTGGVE